MSGNKLEPEFSADALDIDLPELNERVPAGAMADYLQVFGLARDPFDDRPDETEFFPSASHQHVSQQLQHLLHYGSGVLLLHGEEGGGRSLLTRAVVSRLDADTVVCSLDLPSGASAEQVLAEVAHGLALGGDPDYKRRDWVDAISDVCDEMAEEGQSLLMVLDDADRHSDDAIGALLDLISRQADRARALLVVRGQSLDRFKRLLAQREVPAQALGLSGLTADEVYDYLRFRFQRAGNEGFPFSSAQVEEIIEQSGGLPAAVNVQARKLLSATGGKSSGLAALQLPFGLNQYHLGGMAVALVLLLLAVVYAPTGEQPVEAASEGPSAAVAEKVAVEAPAEPMKSIALPAPTGAAAVQQPQENKAPAAAPAAVTAENAVPATAPAGEAGAVTGAIQRTPAVAAQGSAPAAAQVASNAVASVAGQSVPPAAPVEAPKTAAQVAAEAKLASPVNVGAGASSGERVEVARTEPAKVAEANQVPASKVEVKKPVVKKPVEAPKVAPAKVAAKPAAAKPATPTLKGKGYTIQLAGATSEANLRRAIARKAPGLSVQYLRTSLNGKPFFIAVTGDYPTSAAAKAGVESLPSALRADKPWVVSKAAVQAKTAK